MNDPRATEAELRSRRAVSNWSRREKVGRVAWGLAWPLFRLSPRLAWGWRRWLLRRFGARIGRRANIHPDCRITIPWNLEIGDWSTLGEGVILYALGPIRIGRHVTVSQGAHLCAGTHDFETPRFALLKPPITVGDYAWIGAEAFVGPGIEVGEGAVVAARGVVVKPVPAWQVVGGNPAKFIKERRIRFRSDRDQDSPAIDITD